MCILIEKCFICEGNQQNCGESISGTATTQANNTMKTVECSDGDCWAFRIEVGNTITFKRGCFNQTCTGDNQQENCKSIDGKRECKKCCTTENCNTWYLDGIAGASYLTISYALILSAVIGSLV